MTLETAIPLILGPVLSAVITVGTLIYRDGRRDGRMAGKLSAAQSKHEDFKSDVTRLETANSALRGELVIVRNELSQTNAAGIRMAGELKEVADLVDDICDRQTALQDGEKELAQLLHTTAATLAGIDKRLERTETRVDEVVSKVADNSGRLDLITRRHRGRERAAGVDTGDLES